MSLSRRNLRAGVSKPRIAADRARVHRYQAWVPIVVAAALAAGIVAFLAATPDQSSRVASDQLGFTHLSDDFVDAAMRAAAEHHRASNRQAIRERVAGSGVQRWLESLAGDRAALRRGIGSAGETPEATARVDAFVSWADGIVPAAWRIVVVDTSAVADEPGTWAVDAMVHVRLAQANTRIRALRMPAVVQVAAPVRDGGAWRIRDIRVDSPRTRIRAYRDPVVVRSGAVDVVAPAARRDDAARVAAFASRRLAILRSRYDTLPGSATAAVWMVQGTPARRAVLADRSALPDTTHPIASVTADLDLVVDLTAWKTASADARNQALAHALTHVVAQVSVPAFLDEALAQAESGPVPDAAVEVAAAGEAGELERLLLATTTTPPTGDDAALAHTFGTWLLEVHGAAVAADLLGRIDGGLDVDHAIRRVLGATPGGVDARVRAWAGDRTAPLADEDDRTVRDGADTGDESGSGPEGETDDNDDGAATE